MNVRIFCVRAMECMCAQTRSQFILSSERVLGNGDRTPVDSKGKIPSTGSSEEVQTHDAASQRTASPTHYPLSYSAPLPPPIPPPFTSSDTSYSTWSASYEMENWSSQRTVSPTHYPLTYSALPPFPFTSSDCTEITILVGWVLNTNN